MNPVAELVRLFDGKTSLAKALGHRHCTTVQGWEKSGRIPHWRREEVLSAARRSGVVIPPEIADRAFSAPATPNQAAE